MIYDALYILIVILIVQLPLIIVLVASIILLIATGAEYKWSYYGSYEKYAISISSISLSISGISLLLHKFATDLYEKVGKNLSLLNFTWSFVGACFLTFNSPFEKVSISVFVVYLSLLTF